MKPSITSAPRPKWKTPAEKVFAAAFWLAVWQIVSTLLGQEILLVSPARAFFTLWELLGTAAFYKAVAFSFLRILAGFALGVLAGALLAPLARLFSLVRALVTPVMQAAKATPVVSFIILALIWIRADKLSVFTSFLMAMPITYVNIYEGLGSADKKLLEMAAVFGMRPWARVRAIWLPAAWPFLLSAVASALGLCWKAGIAAEVIGIPDGSIGEALYRSKIFLDTPHLFAWTIAVALLSVAFEKAILFLLRRSGERGEAR